MKVLTDAMSQIPKNDQTKATVIDEKIREHCGGLRGKENKLVCFFGTICSQIFHKYRGLV